MGRPGRKRKQGKRTEGNRLVRDNYALPAYDHGTERAQDRKRRFGTHGTSALGRAYASGLLGEQDIALTRYQAGKRFQRAVERFYEHGRVKCPLGREMRSGAVVVQLSHNPQEVAEWEWLDRQSKALHEEGLRPWLDQLVLGIYTDAGPAWLDTMLDVIQWNENLPVLNAQLRAKAKETGAPFTPRWPKSQHPGDLEVLSAAIQALDLIAPQQQNVGIRVVCD